MAQRHLAVLASLCAATIALGCDAPEPIEPSPARHVILLSLDTFRRDAAGPYRNEGESITPQLDAFARDAVIFEGARAQNPFTQPSHMSMFTGLYPMVHRVNGERRKLDPRVRTLAEVLQHAGFRTIGLVVNHWMKGVFGFDRGFDRYELVNEGVTHANALNAVAFEALEAALRDGERVFLFVQYFDAHSDSMSRTETSIPYYSPPPYRDGLPDESDHWCTPKGQCATAYLQAADQQKRKLQPRELDRLVDHYERGIRYLDDELGRFFVRLREFGIYDEALIIVTADHGEEFREHGYFLHSQVYEESVAIPLLIKLPAGRLAGQRVEGLVETIDFTPTILAQLGLEPPQFLQGESLMPAIETGRTTRRFSISQHKHLKRRFAITDGRTKLVHDLRSMHSELYDLARDPEEKIDLASQQPDVVAELTAELERLLESGRALARQIANAPAPDEADPAGDGKLLSEEEKQSLRALGYLEEE